MGTNREIWKDIPGYEGYYQASNLGRIKSLVRIKKANSGTYMSKEIILKQATSRLGYKKVELCKNGTQKNWWVHRAVALAFLPNPNNWPDINHKDENPANNNVSNLEWCTEQYNMNYGTCIDRRKATFVRNKSFVKANATKVRNQSRGAETPIYGVSKNGNTLLSYRSITEASRKTGISKGHIGECVRGIRKSAGGYYWNYQII